MLHVYFLSVPLFWDLSLYSFILLFFCQPQNISRTSSPSVVHIMQPSLKEVNTFSNRDVLWNVVVLTSWHHNSSGSLVWWVYRNEELDGEVDQSPASRVLFCRRALSCLDVPSNSTLAVDLMFLVWWYSLWRWRWRWRWRRLSIYLLALLCNRSKCCISLRCSRYIPKERSNQREV